MIGLKAVAACILLCSALLTACDLINPSEEVPAYLTIRNPVVVVGPNQNDTSSSGIRDAWVWHAGIFQGVYPLPATFPYINVSDTDFFLEGGVFETGQSSFRVPYPFWDRIEFNVSQEPTDTFVIEPVITYRDGTQLEIPIDERFESNQLNLATFNRFDGDTATILKTTTDVFMGTESGVVRFDNDSRHFEAINVTPVPLPLSSQKDVYVEISYKNTVEFSVGLLADGPILTPSIEPALTLLPTDEWKTVYIHVLDIVRRKNTEDPFADYRIWIRASTEGEDGSLFLDNIRLIHQR